MADWSYNIPEHIKQMCAKQITSSTEHEILKVEIVKYLKEYLDLDKGKNSLADVTGIIRNTFKYNGTNYSFERDIAGRMMRTRDYTMKEVVNEGGGKEVYVIAADRDSFDKHRAVWTIGLAIFAFTLGFFGDVMKQRFYPKEVVTDTVQVKVLSMPQLSEPSIQINSPSIPQNNLPISIPKPVDTNQH